MPMMQTLSLRLPDEDYQWLVQNDQAPGKTPSEKLRGLITRMRAQEAGFLDNEACAAWLRSLAAPLGDAVAVHERQTRQHSEAVAAIAEWTPRLMARLITGRIPENAPQSAADLEADLLQQAFRLLSMLLRMGITSFPAVYDARALRAHFPEILEIARIISSRTEQGAAS